MADRGRGRTWLAARAERLYGGRLGRLRHSELSWRVAWKWLPALLAVGFLYGTVFQFTGGPTSQRDPELFSDIPLFILTSVLTGLVLWSMTLLWSFRRLLVFDRGLLYGYAQKHTARAILWEDLDSASLRTVVAPIGADPDSLLKTLEPGDKTALGVRGRFALVFRGSCSAVHPSGTDHHPGPRFFTFSMDRSPDRLVQEIQLALAEYGPGRPPADLSKALPPAPLSTVTRLD